MNTWLFTMQGGGGQSSLFLCVFFLLLGNCLSLNKLIRNIRMSGVAGVGSVPNLCGNPECVPTLLCPGQD